MGEEGKGISQIKTRGDLTRLLLRGELLRALRGCQVVQSCQNQTASLLPTRREGGLRGLSAVFFSKIIILKAFLSRLRRYQQFFFLEFITKKNKKQRVVLFISHPFSSCGRHV